MNKNKLTVVGMCVVGLSFSSIGLADPHPNGSRFMSTQSTPQNLPQVAKEDKVDVSCQVDGKLKPDFKERLAKLKVEYDAMSAAQKEKGHGKEVKQEIDKMSAMPATKSISKSASSSYRYQKDSEKEVLPESKVVSQSASENYRYSKASEKEPNRLIAKKAAEDKCESSLKNQVGHSMIMGPNGRYEWGAVAFK